MRRAALLGLMGAMALSWASAAQTVVAARLADPTNRYPHRVLGTIPEHTTLMVTLTGAPTLRITHLAPMVFEDIAPRVIDLDGDARPEVIVVESHETLGARLAIYGHAPDGHFGLRAAGPFIGQRFRWMAVIGAADLDGDGALEIALIDRPHLAKVLRIIRVDGLQTHSVTLREIASLADVTNHRIGDEMLLGGIRDCGEGPELVLASGDYSQVRIIGFSQGRLTGRSGGAASTTAFANHLSCIN